MGAIDLAKQNKGQAIIDAIKSYLKEASSSDEEFERRLNGNLYTDNPDATRFLLCYYEERFRTNEIYTDLWSRDKNNKYKWTIEHIFPEGDNIPQSWIDMIAGGDRALAQEYLSKYAHTLGNLTITGYNSNLSNLSFEKKRDRKNNDGLFIGYRNGLKLNADVVNKDAWSVKDITARTEGLVKYFKTEFAL